MGEAECPFCGRELPASGRTVLAVVILVLIALFALTHYLVKSHHNTELGLANSWYLRGERAMTKGYPAIAAEDFRTALSYDRDNREYRLRLAQALLAEKHFPEARSHLLSLWEQDPASGEVNLTLARLNAQQGDETAAVRYYRNAINGVWSTDPRQQRIGTRFELLQYLLQQHDTRQAGVELVALQADPPEEISLKLELANLLAESGEFARAQGVYESILKSDPTNAAAWLGNGSVSIALGDYRGAQRELDAALDQDPTLTEAKQQLDFVQDILGIAPGLRGLSLNERARRVALAFDAAFTRLTTCTAQKGYAFAPPPGSPGKPADATRSEDALAGAPQLNNAPENLQHLYLTALQMKSAATQDALRNHPDSIESAMDFVFAVETTTLPLCSNMSETDRALLQLAKHQSEMTQ